MFTGITTDVGEVIAVEPRTEGLRRLKLACSYPRDSIAIGASISHSGVCLTVVETAAAGNRTAISVDTAAETLRMTTAGAWKQGTRLNLERALKMGDELGGHIVAGHVDGVAELVSRENLTDMARLTLRAPRELMRFVASKGSVALDGVSLTVNEVTAETFSVLIIPHTLSVTTLGAARPGDAMNLEIDLMARYAARLMETK
ncbi:MAG: riboflavin synthase [Alphaproteobacteria bacterium]|jgi:riboflavin synthase|nr:riboflavin synthase [Alphaproteobacteria bacterium]